MKTEGGREWYKSIILINCLVGKKIRDFSALSTVLSYISFSKL
jgi:hypothetical protein